MNRRMGLLALAAVALLGLVSDVPAATLTVKNNCGYTIYPGIYPPVYQNGGWSQGAGAQVSFTIASGWIGRVWGRLGCNTASPAQCTTGQCGGTGLQCAGTTGVPTTALFEANINASGTDWYDISYVDAVDSPMGLSVSNGSCVSPSVCPSSVISNCPATLKSGNVCLSGCTKYNTDQYCCRGAYGTQATCVVANWGADAKAYVNNIHSLCPNQYSYAYDEGSGALQTCATGINYTLTFCPSGGSSATATPTTAPRARATATPRSRARATATPRSGARATATPTTSTGCSGTFTNGVDNVSATQARPWFKLCSGTASYVILHYIRPGLGQQNVQTTYNSAAARWEFTVSGMAAGQVLQYQFTYNNGTQHDTAWFSWTHP